MKKVILVAIMVFSTSSLVNANTSEVSEGPRGECGSTAWAAADRWCAKRGGCSDYQAWYFTDIAYSICKGEL